MSKSADREHAAPADMPTVWQILADVLNGSLALREANSLMKVHLRIAEQRGGRQQSKDER